MVHNEPLILFCENDREVLCLDCMYQEGEHEKHQIVAIKKHLEEIASWNEGNRSQIEHQVVEVDKNLETIIQNKQFLENTFNKISSEDRKFF